MKLAVDEVNKIIYSILKNRHPIIAEMFVNWIKIVGIKLSFKSHPLKIVTTTAQQKKINILYIAVDNSSVLTEMSYHQELIIERIAVYFGYKAIHKIKLSVRG